jgi:hypothetical protein
VESLRLSLCLSEEQQLIEDLTEIIAGQRKIIVLNGLTDVRLACPPNSLTNSMTWAQHEFALVFFGRMGQMEDRPPATREKSQTIKMRSVYLSTLIAS